mmetsp:Transcript_12637/g.18903  ORF Transcript_12637/g.18903 Transcript_12637/m.18903 type:complete len:91 (+) Transcript_12637:110-382(+)
MKRTNQKPTETKVLSVSSKSPSVLTFRARKNKKLASFVIPAADDKVTLVHVEDSKDGREASANAPVPNRSKWRWEPDRIEMAKPSTFIPA